MLRLRVPSPIGELTAFVHGGALVALELPSTRRRAEADLGRRFGAPATRDAEDALDLKHRFRAYLAGDLAALDAIPVETGGTPFQRAVWAALRRIPPGTTCSYSQLAGVV